MKRTNFLGMLFLAFLTMASLAACSDDDNEGGRKITGSKEYVLTVASEKVPGVLWSEGANYLSEVYAVKKEQSDDWSAMGSINGFEYEKGYEYQIRVRETSYLDYAMGEPAWTERDLVEVISKEKKDSENVPSHFIPKAFYENIPLPAYRDTVEANHEEIVKRDLEDHPLIPLDDHDMFYRGGDNLLRWIAMRDEGDTFDSYVIETRSKKPEEMPESYKMLPPTANIVGYGVWTLLDESGTAIDGLSFDVFYGYRAKDYNRMPTVIYLYKDLTAYYQAKYPEAGVKTVVVSYMLSSNRF